MATETATPETDSSAVETVKLPGPVKAAILLLAVDAEQSAQVMKHFDKEMIEEVSRVIASLQYVDFPKRRMVVQEFYHLALAHQHAASGGLGYAKSLLYKALPAEEAAHVMRQIERRVYQEPFSFLRKADVEQLLTFIQDEHPQTIALILSHLTPAKGAEILTQLPQGKQMEVVSRISHMEQTNPEVIKEVEQGLEARISGLMSQTFQKTGGVDTVASMLNLADRATEKSILEKLEADDPELAENIRRLMFVFDDIILLNDKGIQAVLKEIENDDLALALKTANEDLGAKIFGNMSERAASLVKEDMMYMGPVRVSDVEAAQQRIVDVVRRLEDSGDIIIAGRGGDEGVVV
jgi:flagellar motor switch protein FliG